MEKYFYPKILGKTVLAGGPTPGLLNYAVDYIAFCPDSEFDLNIAANMFSEAFNDQFGGVPDVFMHESFTFRYFNYFDQKKVINRISSVFKNSLFVLGTRSQTNWLASHWCQYIRSGGLLKFEEFCQLLLNRKNSDLYMCYFGEIGNHLKIKTGVKKYLIYDVQELKNLKSLQNRFIKLGVAAKHTNENMFTQFQKVNSSDNLYVIKLMRMLNHIIPHDCGTHPYATSETDKITTDLKFRIKYKFKYVKINFLNMISPFISFLTSSKSPLLSQVMNQKINKIFEKDKKMLKDIIEE